MPLFEQSLQRATGNVREQYDMHQKIYQQEVKPWMYIMNLVYFLQSSIARLTSLVLDWVYLSDTYRKIQESRNKLNLNKQNCSLNLSHKTRMVPGCWTLLVKGYCPSLVITHMLSPCMYMGSTDNFLFLFYVDNIFASGVCLFLFDFALLVPSSLISFSCVPHLYVSIS